jgi:uncharacterized phage-associated protein
MIMKGHRWNKYSWRVDVEFEFRERKAVQAADYLLRLGKGKMSYMKLIKLLYLADRKSLVETGVPITGDRMFSMDNGPVLSRIYDAIKGQAREMTIWREYISPPDGYEVAVRSDRPPPQSLVAYDELSRYDIRVLTEMHLRYGRYSKWDLVKVLHNELPEWKNPSGSSTRIDPADILTAAGKTQGEIQRIAREAESSLAFAAARGRGW